MAETMMPQDEAAAPTPEEWAEAGEVLFRMSEAKQEIFFRFVRRVAEGMAMAESEQLLWRETAALKVQ